MMRGDQTTVAHLLSFFAARGHSVDFFTLDVDGGMTVEQEVWLRQSCRRVEIYRQKWPAKLAGVLRSLVGGLPLQIGLFKNSRLKKDLARAIQNEDFDIIYCYYPRTATAVPPVERLPRGMISFLALQLSQTLNTERMAKNESSLLKRMVFLIEARLMSRFESHVWKRFHRVVLIGPADVQAVREQCRAHNQPEIDNWVYGAHGTDTDRFIAAEPKEVIPNRVVFSGSMLYPPNIQAVLWFVEKVWPSIRVEVPTASFVVQGRDPAPKILALDGSDGIEVTGTVPDVGEIIRSASVCVNPMLAAGGMQNKLIEYMASGKAVVASSIANEGIMAPSGTLAIADTPGQFAKSVIGLLTDSAEAAAVGARAREYVLENWTWEKHFLDLERDFERALDTQASTAQSNSDNA